MLRKTKKSISVLLSLLMVLTAWVFAAPAASALSVGDTIQFGTYPQTKVTDSTLIAALNAAPKSWASYKYYTGTGTLLNVLDSQMQPGDWMRYADFFYGGEKYRAVTFTQYRPEVTGETSSESTSYQDDNGYTTDTLYYFKYEPLTWRVLDPSTGYIMCASLIDCQAYQNTLYRDGSNFYQAIGSSVYANDYAASSIRDWLNYDFYETAFAESQKANIKTTALNNDACSTKYSQYNSAATNDKLFLLSYADAQNAGYGFSSDSDRIAQGTDYAKCQGLYVNNGNSWWLLRSPGRSSYHVCSVSYSGRMYNDWFYVSFISCGIRPACQISNLTSDIAQSETLFSCPKAANPLSYSDQSVNKTFSTDAQTATLAAATDGQGDVSYAISSQPSGDYFTLDGTTLTIAANTPAGTYDVVVTATAAGNDNYNEGSADSTVTVTIAKATPTLTPAQTPTKIDDLTYDGHPQTLITPPSELPDGYDDVLYSPDNGVSWTNNPPEGTDAGDYTVKVKYIGDDNHETFTGDDISVNIAKATAALADNQKPTANELTYTGEPQPLVTAPSEVPTGYTVQYSLDGETWSDEIPTGTDAGDYTVKVKYIGDDNHETFTGDDIPVSIAKMPAPTLTDDQKPTANELTYTGEPQPLVTAPSEVPTGYTAVQYSIDNGTTWSTEIPTGTDAGDYTVKVKYIGDDNHETFTGDDIPVSIAKMPAPTLTDDQKPTAIKDLTYTGEPQPLVNAPSDVPAGYTVQYSLDGETWSTEIPTGTDAGDYTVKVKYVGDDNHETFFGDDLSVSIAKAEPTPTDPTNPTDPTPDEPSKDGTCPLCGNPMHKNIVGKVICWVVYFVKVLIMQIFPGVKKIMQ